MEFPVRDLLCLLRLRACREDTIHGTESTSCSSLLDHNYFNVMICTCTSLLARDNSSQLGVTNYLLKDNILEADDRTKVSQKDLTITADLFHQRDCWII